MGILSGDLDSKQGTRDETTGRLLPADGKKADALRDAGLSTSTAQRYEVTLMACAISSDHDKPIFVI